MRLKVYLQVTVNPIKSTALFINLKYKALTMEITS